MSRKPVLPALQGAVRSIPTYPVAMGEEKVRARAELRAAESVIRAAKRVDVLHSQRCRVAGANQKTCAGCRLMAAFRRLDALTGRTR